MKKILSILCTAVMMLGLTACGTESQHSISYERGERINLYEQYDCVAVYTKYTNGSSDTVIPADYVSVKAYQNGIELSILVPTGDRINDYVPCDTNIQGGTTADVVWLFQLDDDSPVSVELSDGSKYEISLTEE